MSETKQTVTVNWEYAESLSCDQVHRQLSNLLGKVLTLIDASVADSRQNKALKDLVKAEFNIKVRRFRAWSMPEGTSESDYKLIPDFD